jgi:hypothetical protein
VPPNFFDGLNIIACPSCSRVENERFIELAARGQAMTAYAKEHDLTIAVMGCRVNGPGETDDADLGLWCGPNFVNLKRGPADARRLQLRRHPRRPQARARCVDRGEEVTRRGGVVGTTYFVPTTWKWPS